MRVWIFDEYEYERGRTQPPKGPFHLFSVMYQSLMVFEDDTRKAKRQAEELLDILEDESVAVKETVFVRNRDAGLPGQPDRIENESVRLREEGAVIIVEDDIAGLMRKAFNAADKKTNMAASRTMNAVDDFLDNAPKFNAQKQRWDHETMEVVDLEDVVDIKAKRTTKRSRKRS